jgi:predicted PurR-regulated permease PerM
VIPGVFPKRLPWPLVAQVLGVVAGVWLVIHTWQIWLLAFAALIVAAAILPAARVAERYNVPRGVTVLLIYVMAAGVLALMGRLLWPALSEQGRQFMEQLPRLLENVRGWLGDFELFLGRWGATLPTPGTERLQSVAGSLVANTFRATAGAVGALFGLLAVLVIAAYVVIDANRIGTTFLAFVPAAHRPLVSGLAAPVLDRIGGYVRGQIVSSLFVGVLIAAALGAIGVRYALLIGALAAVLNIVPFVGATVAAVLAVLSALNESLSLALFAAVLMTAAQMIEGKFLAPHFVGKATGLHPLAVLLALLMGAHVAGLIGALVAVPFVAGLWQVVQALAANSTRVVIPEE